MDRGSVQSACTSACASSCACVCVAESVWQSCTCTCPLLPASDIIMHQNLTCHLPLPHSLTSHLLPMHCHCSPAVLPDLLHLTVCPAPPATSGVSWPPSCTDSLSAGLACSGTCTSGSGTPVATCTDGNNWSVTGGCSAPGRLRSLL